MHCLGRIAFIVAAGSLVSGCGALNTGLSTMLADNWPTWAGGLPKDTPPRPGDPRYAEYEREQQAKAVIAAQPATEAARPQTAVLRRDETPASGDGGDNDDRNQAFGRGLH